MAGNCQFFTLTAENRKISPQRLSRQTENRLGAPPDLKSKAPDPAATGSSASIAYRAGGQGDHSTSAAPIASRIIVEQGLSGAYVVTVRPVLAFREFERAFPIAWDALEYADLLGGELGCGVLDRSGMAL